MPSETKLEGKTEKEINELTGSATAIDVASNAQARLTIAREVKAAD